MKSPTRAALLLALSLTFLGLAVSLPAAEKSGKRKLPAEWTPEEAQTILRESPWAQQITLLQITGRILGRLPDGQVVIYQEAPGLPPRHYSEEVRELDRERVQAVYSVRWSSAGIIAQALARLGEIAPVLRESEAPPPELSAEHYVITVRVVEPPAESKMQALERPLVILDEGGRPVREAPLRVADLFAGLSVKELETRAELRTAAGLRLKPERVLRHGVGSGEGISFFFPRQQNGRATLPPGTAWAEFLFEGTQGDKLKARFTLKEMQYGGRLDY